MASSVNLDVAERLDITCRRGDTFSLTLTLNDSSGNAITLATSGYEFLMDVKTVRQRTRSGLSEREVIASSSLSPSTSNAKALTSDQKNRLSNGFEFKDITDSGTVNVTASADTMSNLPVGSFEYDIQQKVGDVVTTILRGSFTVNEDISN
tara:strand:- start:871 stop:1323 length:453 start_codon:yes stop_codon:yes gene_type:complete